MDAGLELHTGNPELEQLKQDIIKEQQKELTSQQERERDEYRRAPAPRVEKAAGSESGVEKPKAEEKVRDGDEDSKIRGYKVGNVSKKGRYEEEDVVTAATSGDNPRHVFLYSFSL